MKNNKKISDSSKSKLFGGGWRRPIKDEFGNKWCNCLIPNLTSNIAGGKGLAYCLRCHCYWYH